MTLIKRLRALRVLTDDERVTRDEAANALQAVLDYFGDEPDSTLRPAEKRLRDMAKGMKE